MTAKRRILAGYSNEEVADAMMIPAQLTKKQAIQEKSNLAEARRKLREKSTEKDRLISRLLQFKLILDDYLKSSDYIPGKTFGFFLKEYISLLNRKRREFAREIGIKETELSQLINQHRTPPEYIVIRLEIHSNNAIRADKWLMLVEKEKMYSLQIDRGIRKRERAYVTHKLDVVI